MNEDIKPIKRSPELTPLSRDHHDGLLLVWKIRQGIKNGTPLELIGRYLQYFWDEHLQKHFREEEELLQPLAPADPMMQQMMEEHNSLQQMIQASSWNEERLLQFAAELNDHIRFEERQLFPFIEKNASAEDLQKILQHLDAAPASCANWTDEFWLKK